MYSSNKQLPKPKHTITSKLGIEQYLRKKAYPVDLCTLAITGYLKKCDIYTIYKYHHTHEQLLTHINNQDAELSSLYATIADQAKLIATQADTIKHQRSQLKQYALRSDILNEINTKLNQEN